MRGGQLALLLSVLLLSVFPLTGCDARSAGGNASVGGSASPTVPDADAEPKSSWVFAMNTVMEFTAYGADAEAALADAETAVTDLENLLSVTDGNSEIYRVNNGEPGVAVTVSEQTAYLLDNALRFCARTDGALDISIYPVVRAWGFTTDAYRIPTDGELLALLKSVDYTAIAFDPLSRGICLPEGMQLDLGAVAKGYASDVAADAMRARGVASAVLSLGGNVQTIGSKPDGSAWRVAVRNPDDAERYAGVLEVRNMAVVTSGGYERYFVGDDGEIYWHIFDPATGRPARNGLISVTIISDSGMTGDALSTSFFVMGLDAASAYWREYGNFEMTLITEDREIYITEGLETQFEALDEYAARDVTVIRK
jgi:thiamine biosynthesis lipoprotein